jgi:acetoin utilization deacetylase AcuC-like enzyme
LKKQNINITLRMWVQWFSYNKRLQNIIFKIINIKEKN